MFRRYGIVNVSGVDNKIGGRATYKRGVAKREGIEKTEHEMR